ncbi:hypothetical protein P8625_00150 [Tenacibaculum tangerinum]|uniref:Outer membrane protein beta-barrel domain-containing protein n=1 Tax=Tenacibaculum tangerinum TaxID=3038772 RepID=A0ABY8L2D2_9FLAO|nr:hypothetical protein [Tenacibaculum tangerinum]WGH75608.1 hypothetical protein P8625_00150 [Tenacibaculum tangerinum]
MVIDLITKGEIELEFENSIESSELDSFVNFFFGFGYNFNHKISLEFRYNNSRKIYASSNVINLNDRAAFNNFSLKIGYNFLK